jgi:enamine deaminase RidA (YjgF/YER057c/UK114 family)
MRPRREIIDPKEFPHPPFHYSPAVKFGSWVFASMQMATDYKSGIVNEARIPYQSTDTGPQARVVLQQLSHLLETAGSSLQHQVKADNYYASRRHFGSREIRHKLMPVGAPPGMALHANRMLVPGALLTIEPIAVVKNSPPKEPLQTNAVALPVAAYSQAVRWGDWVFLAGDMATDFKHALAPEVETDTRTWFQEPIELQTRYTLKKLKTILEYAGSSLQDVVHARVAMVDPENISGMERVWRETWPEHPPARNIVFANSLASEACLIEIFVTALVHGSRLPREEIRTDNAPRSLFHEPQALRVGDLLFLSTQLAVNEYGLDPSVPLKPGFPFFGNSAKQQMEVMLRNIKAICEAGGASLATVLRTQMQFTNLSEFDAAREIWENHFGPEPPAMSAAEMRGPFPVPGCSVLLDVVAGVAD